MNPKFQHIKEITSKILVPLGILFVVYIGIRYWEKISLAFDEFDHLLFAVSVAAGILGNLGIALLFRSLLVKHNTPIKPQDAISLFYVSQITKYVPGKIWGILYQASHVEGMVGAVAIFLANIELMAIGLLANVSIAIAILAFNISPTLSIVTVMITIAITYYISRFNLLYFIRNFLGKKLNVEDLGEIKRSESFEFALVGYWLSSIIFIGANMAVLSAFFDLDGMSSLTLIGYLLLAWAVGVFAIVMPGGIGVREVVFLLIAGSASEYSTDLLASVAIVNRLWQVTLDFSGAAVVFALRRFFWSA